MAKQTHSLMSLLKLLKDFFLNSRCQDFAYENPFNISHLFGDGMSYSVLPFWGTIR